MSTEMVFLGVCVVLLAVLIALVRRHHDRGAIFSQRAQRLEDMHGAHDIRGVSFQRMFVGITNERLGGEVENKIRLDAEEGFFYDGGVTYIGNFVIDYFGKAELFED